ncbi:MAG: benzylsuccinate synthase gamma subunit family protein [Desulfomonilaceae bacterium]|nr:benzylsuccinate synthase gamma subunit family protein [Desulfomonilaceae bacterium]
MATCKDCKGFFAREDDQDRGDCVMRVTDPRQAYYKAVPVEADKDASKCSSFRKR